MKQLIPERKTGLLFILSGPAGTGKTTLVRKLLEEFPSIVESVSYTTREPRGGEEEGKDYYFISKEEFEKRMREEEFLETAKVYENYYGTSKLEVERLQKKGKYVVLVIDTQGAMHLKEVLPVISVFISPPDFEELKTRLEKRGADTAESMEKRLFSAKEEVKFKAHYDYHIINDDLFLTYEILRSIFVAEAHKNR